MSSLVPSRPPPAADDIQVGSEHESGPIRADLSPASGSTSRRASISRVALSIVDVPGLLLWTGVLALAGGAWIHSSVDRLPQDYTWSLPFRTLRNVIGEASFPLWALVAFAMGRAQTCGWRGISEAAREGVVRWRSSPVGALLTAFAQRYRLALVVAATVMLLDWVAFPGHRWIDSLAMSLAAFVAAARATRRRGVSAVLDVAVGVLVFAAVCYWFTVVKTLTFASRVQWDAAIANFEKALVGVYPHRWAAALFSRYPGWVQLMDSVYLSIFEHMAIATSFLLGVGDARERDRYLGALCFCYVLGAPLYLCMPAAGPVYFDPSTYAFLSRQPLAANYVQAVLYDNTAAVNEGRAASIQTWGYIACMPSLHMAHEFVMLYYARRSPVFFAGTLVFFLMTAMSVVVLGWHYPTDILAGVVLGVLAIVISRSLGPRLFPRALRSTFATEEKPGLA